MNITTIGIDLSKNFFQIHGTDAKGKAILKKKVTRNNFLNFAANLPKCKVYMEACGASNYWGREFIKLGHEVQLIAPKYTKAFVKTNKNDANDAEAIVEAGIRPNMRFVEVKTREQQDVQSIHRIRERLVIQRTALANQIRGLLLEYGIAISQGISKLRAQLPKIIESDKLSLILCESLADLYEEIQRIDERIKRFDDRIKRIFEQNEICKKIVNIPGVGILTATMLASILGNGVAFKNGRHFAAFLGLVPKQASTGGKDRLLGISKRGNRYLRKLLVHGGRSVLYYAARKKDKDSIWLHNLARRKGFNKATVAWANKVARRVWAIVYYGTEYLPVGCHNNLDDRAITSGLAD